MTPLFKQQTEIKAQYPDTICLFRCGEFFEAFGPDADLLGSLLGLVVSKRRTSIGGDFISLSGMPHHAKDEYLMKLVKAGHKVAIVDNIE